MNRVLLMGTVLSLLLAAILGVLVFTATHPPLDAEQRACVEFAKSMPVDKELRDDMLRRCKR